MNNETKLYVLTVFIGEYDSTESFVLGVFSSQEKAEEKEDADRKKRGKWPKLEYSYDVTTLDSGVMED